ncbi:Histone RNA hairpin-binding protein RNA-binding domain-containing protein [Entamoeba marina]
MAIKFNSKPYTPKKKIVSQGKENDMNYSLPDNIITPSRQSNPSIKMNYDLPSGISRAWLESLFKEQNDWKNVYVSPGNRMRYFDDYSSPIRYKHTQKVYSDSKVDMMKRKEARQKQITFGKNTIEYKNYIALIPYEDRISTDPKTPDIGICCSKRRWDFEVRKWRRALHAFDDVHDKNQINEARKYAVLLENEHDPKNSGNIKQYQGIITSRLTNQTKCEPLDFDE